MEWIKVEAGEYWSKDERFHIIICWDRMHVNHWELWDTKTGETHPGDSLRYCKQIAGTLAEHSKYYIQEADVNAR